MASLIVFRCLSRPGVCLHSIVLAVIGGLLGLSPTNAQLTVSRDPQAVAIAAQSLGALAHGVTIADATLGGQAASTLGSDVENGPAVLKALGYFDSRIVLDLDGGERQEVRRDTVAAWAGSDKQPHTIPIHNAWTTAGWFFPPLVMQTVSTNTNFSLAYVGQELLAGNSVQHLRMWRVVLGQDPGTGELIERLSAMDLYIDAVTYLPQAIAFNVHPDDDATHDLPVEIDFNDYRDVKGIKVPFRIRKSLQRDLVLDISANTVTINSGLTENDFQIQ